MLVKLELSLPTEARYVGTMRGVANVVMSDLGVPPAASGDIELAVGEACANAVRHSDVTEYIVRLEVGDQGCEVEVIDLGEGFEPEQGPSSPGGYEETGRGIPLMHALVDELEFAREGDGTHVRLRKRWAEGFSPEA